MSFVKTKDKVEIFYGTGATSPRSAIGEAFEGWYSEDLQELPARHADDASRNDQRRAFGFLQSLTRSGEAASNVIRIPAAKEIPMDRRTFVSTTVAAAASSLLVAAARAQPIPRAKNVVLIHGLFADGSCWSEVIARLQARGIQATAVQNPLTTLQAAVEATQQILAWQQGPTVLVAHSFGGMILTEAGVDPKVSALVYVAARAPDAGEDYAALAGRYPTPPASAGIVWSDDWGRLSEDAFLRDFAADVPAEKARVLCAVQAPFKRTLLADKTTHAAWRSKPSWYAVSTEDRTINPDLERFMAKRMGAKTIEVKASHVSLISQPDAIANLILEAAGQT